MKPRFATLKLLALLGLALPALHARAEDTDWSGSWRAIGESARANHDGVLAPANTRMNAGRDSLRGELALKARSGPWQGQATLTQSQQQPGGSLTQSLINEAYWSGQAADWHFTLGKKIVSWDVGQGFRPLDVIQQENRRTLNGATLEGVRVAMAERYAGDAALSLVIANPLKPQHASGRDEAAAALRYYLRRGNTDWHAVARWGRDTGARAGLAVASVVSDALEVHASLARAESLQRYVDDGSNYHLQTGKGGWQGLAGLSWTSESQITLMTEYWHDSRALRSADWRTWQARTKGIPAWLPTDARSGMLADLAPPFGNANLRRDNVLLRAAWSDARWSPAADMVYTPADHGRVTTVSLAWQGDVFSMEGGYRRFDGPGSATVCNLPDRDRFYLWAKYPF